MPIYSSVIVALLCFYKKKKEKKAYSDFFKLVPVAIL